MGVLAATDITVKELPADPLKLLDILANVGWTLSDSENICYLPLGDNDSFNWKSVPISTFASVQQELYQKLKSSELIGICLTWENSGVGGQLLYDVSKKNLGFVWNINRRRREDSEKYTDFSWYEEKLVNALKAAHVEIIAVHSKDIE
jgi:hypothetical protein